MECVWAYVTAGASIGALAVVLFMQGLPPRFVVNQGTLAVSKTWWWNRQWSLPAHMLNPFGRKLRMAWIGLCWVFFLSLGLWVLVC